MNLNNGAASPWGGGELLMRNYELMYIINPELDTEATEAVVEKFDTLIANNGGEVSKTDKWGKRRLAYEIDKKKDGFYVLTHFKGEPAAVHELDRVMKITEGVLKHMIIREEE